MMAVGGWFDNKKVIIDSEYDCEEECEEFIEINADEYEKLVKDKKSFVLLVDQGGCKTADKVREFIKKWAVSNKKRVYRIMFEEMKKTSLHEVVKYYPSVVIFDEGRVANYLRADSDEDTEKYNDEGVFDDWLSGQLAS